MLRSDRRALVSGFLRGRAWVWVVLLLVVGGGVLFVGRTAAVARTYSDEETAFLELLNEYREDNGLESLLVSDLLSAAALRHSSDMAKYEFFGHTTEASDYFPVGSDPFRRMALCGYDYATNKGEIIAAGCATARQVLDVWVGSDVHRQELLRSCYKVVGISRFYRAGSAYGYYWTVDLGGWVDPTAQAGSVTTTTTTPPSSTTTGSTTTTTSGPPPYFTDVPPGAPYYEAVMGLQRAGIVNGYAVGDHREFRPAEAVNRAQFAKVACGAFRLTVTEDLACWFSDLGPDDPTDLYPDDYVAAAALSGIALGVGNNMYAPWAAISRAQAVTMIVRGAQQYAAETLQTPPQGYDCPVPGTGDPTHDANMALAEHSGLLTGIEGVGSGWNPWSQASRAEVAQMLWNVMQ